MADVGRLSNRAVPTSLDDASLASAKARRVRGTLLSTEQDDRLKDQKALMDRLGKIGLKVRTVITPNIGHWYPQNLGELIDAAIEHIRQGK